MVGKYVLYPIAELSWALTLLKKTAAETSRSLLRAHISKEHVLINSCTSRHFSLQQTSHVQGFYSDDKMVGGKRKEGRKKTIANLSGKWEYIFGFLVHSLIV